MEETIQQTVTEILDFLKDKELTYKDIATALSWARIEILEKREMVANNLVYSGE